MKASLVIFAILLTLASIFMLAKQVKATYSENNLRSRLIRSILGGFFLNTALLSIEILKALFIDHSQDLVQAARLSEGPILFVVAAFTLALYGLFGFRKKIRQYYRDFDDRYGQKED